MQNAAREQTDANHGRALAWLRSDGLRHIVTLKMLAVGGAAIDCRLCEEADGWGLLSLFSTKVFEYDQQTYADRERVVLIDGTSAGAKAKLLETLPRGALVVKTYDEAVKTYLEGKYGAKRVRSFVSFTGFPGGPRFAPAREIAESATLTPEVAAMFAANGYEASELARHFGDGARWFGIQEAGQMVSACMVFRNFETVWEIGGVYTLPEHRRRGLARQVVAAALEHLHQAQRRPRYQVRADNLASIELARAAGLREFLRMEHFLVDRKD
ncbi:MAG TPA: GNAT family N-acetyltransferase [Opitutales bacterium]|nr:GNAT family N-acetyltransferase [Opitutales bacterium]